MLVFGAAYGAGDETWNGRKLRLVMEDTFDGALDLKKWEREVSLWGGGVSTSHLQLIVVTENLKKNFQPSVSLQLSSHREKLHIFKCEQGICSNLVVILEMARDGDMTQLASCRNLYATGP